MIIYSNKSLNIPNGINPNFGAYTPTGELQQKTVNSSTSEQEVLPDSGYVGMYKVTVNPYTLDSSSLVVSRNGEYTVRSAADGLSKVDVSVNIDVQSYYDEGYSAGEAVGEATGKAEGIAEQKAKLDSSTFRGNGRFTREDGWNDITVDVTEVHNQNKSVDSSTISQSITADSGYTGLGTVTVNPYTLDSKTVDPSTNSQTVTSSEDGLSSVTVNPVTNDIDSNIAAGNIKSGVTILGVEGTFDGGTLQSKTVDSSTVSQTVSPDGGNYGLSSVTVNPYTLDSSSLVVTENGEYTVTSEEDGLSRVDVSVNIDTSSYYQSGYSAGETAGIAEGIAEQKAKLDSSTFRNVGTFTREDGWDEITVDIETVNNQNKTVDSSYNSQTITFDSGYTGLGTVTINPYAAQSKSVDVSTLIDTVRGDTSTGSSATITPGSGYTALSQVGYQKVAIRTKRLDIPFPGLNKSIYWKAPGCYAEDVEGDYNTIDPTKGVMGASYINIAGAIAQDETVDPSTSRQSVSADEEHGYAIRTVTINPVTSSIDSNIQASNIRDGVTILGVTGNYVGGNTDIDIYESMEIPAGNSSNYCVFDTGIYFDSDSSIKFDGIWYTGGGWTMGTDNSVEDNFAFTCSDVNMPNPWYLCWHSGSVNGTDPNDPSVYDANEHVWELGNQSITRDGVNLWTGSPSTFASKQSFAIGGTKNSGGSFGNYPEVKFFFKYIEFYHNGVKIRQYKPAKDTSNNICLFDTITHSVVYMQGSGTPVLGSYVGSDKIWSSLHVTPSTSGQSFTAGIDTSTVIGVVNVDGVTSSIDNNIQPENIKAGVSILGVNGSYTPVTQFKRAKYISNDKDGNRSVYIDTEITPTMDTVIEITMERSDSTYDNWGGWTGLINSPYSFALFHNNGEQNVSLLWQQDGNSDSFLQGPVLPLDYYPHTYRIGIDASGNDYIGYVDYDCSVYSTAVGSYECQWNSNHHIFIFAVQSAINLGVDQYAPTHMKVYRYRILQGGVPVFDAVPVYDYAAQEYELYDKVTGKYATRYGSFNGEIDEDYYEYEDYIQNATYDGTTGRSLVGFESADGAASTYYFDFAIKFSAPNNSSDLQHLFTISSAEESGEVLWMLFQGQLYGDTLKIYGDIDPQRGTYVWSFPSDEAAVVLNYSNLTPGAHILRIKGYGANYYRVYLDNNLLTTWMHAGSANPRGAAHKTRILGYPGYQSKSPINGAKVYWYEIVGGDNVRHRYVPWYYDGEYSFYDTTANTRILPNNNLTAQGLIYLR